MASTALTEMVQDEAQKERDIIQRINIFSGNIKEYESWKGYHVEIIDTGRNDKGIKLTINEEGEVSMRVVSDYVRDLRDLLVRSGVEAIVNAMCVPHYRSPQTEQDYYGLPVRRKREVKIEERAIGIDRGR